MSGIDAQYEAILAERRRQDAAKAAAAVQAQRALARARDQIFGTVSERVKGSSLSWAMKTVLCSKCPCIYVQRLDRDHTAARVHVTVQNGIAMMSMEGGYEQVPVETSANWLRAVIDAQIAGDFANYGPGIHPWVKWGLIALASVILIPIAIAVGVALLQVAAVLLMFGICLTAFFSIMRG
jgi:hypothetical protein